MYRDERYHLNMKFMALCILIVSNSLFASPDVLKCLGREEAYIHKQKIGGAYKSLNQAMIGELVLLGKSLSIGVALQNKLCAKETLFPSFLLLEKILLEGSQTLRHRGDLASTKDFSDQQTLKTLNTNIFDIFVEFLTKLQAQVDDPHCFIKKYPELKEFYMQAQHVFEEQGSKKILSDFKSLPKLLEDISSGRWKSGCEKKS